MKIIVIGSGLLGVSTAYFLAKKGHEVIVIERQPDLALETSFANGGMMTPSQADPWNEPGIIWRLLKYFGREHSPISLRPTAIFSYLSWGTAFLRHSSKRRYYDNVLKNARIADYNLRLMKQLRQEVSLNYDLAEVGTMKIYRDEESLSEGTDISELTNQTGVRFEVADTKRVLELEPALRPVADRIVGGIYYPDDESGDAYKFCAALAGYAREAGVRFEFDKEVVSVPIQSEKVKVVQTRKGDFTGDAYILAAGSYSPLIAKTLGLRLPVRPVKGYSVTLDMKDWLDKPRMPIVDHSLHLGLTPMGERLRVVGVAELSGYNRGIDRTRVDNLIKIFASVYPEFAPRIRRDTVSEWTGLRPYCSDGVPIIGKTPIRNLFLNTGHGHLGWSMAAGSGKLLADYISEGKSEMDISPYQLDRFA